MKVFRNNDDEPPKRRPRRNDRHAMVRDRYYEEVFGPLNSVIHESKQHVPHVDVYISPPETSGRDYVTMVTSGMSDIEMPTPIALGRRCSRAELVFYCRDVRLEYANMLRRIAHYPHDRQTWLGPCHTYQAEELLDLDGRGHTFAGVLFLPAPFTPDNRLPELLQLDGTPVKLLWVVPLTAAELELAQTRGTDALLDVLAKQEHPIVFDPGRESYVRDGVQ